MCQKGAQLSERKERKFAAFAPISLVIQTPFSQPQNLPYTISHIQLSIIIIASNGNTSTPTAFSRSVTYSCSGSSSTSSSLDLYQLVPDLPLLTVSNLRYYPRPTPWPLRRHPSPRHFAAMQQLHPQSRPLSLAALFSPHYLTFVHLLLAQTLVSPAPNPPRVAANPHRCPFTPRRRLDPSSPRSS